jgi:hypothetical protein
LQFCFVIFLFHLLLDSIFFKLFNKMTTQIKNLFFPIPDNHSSTLHGFGVNESYQMGTLNMIPTMNPIPPSRPGGLTMGQKMAGETLEELEESLDYLECTKKCKRRRHGSTLSPAEIARLQDASHGAHHDLLYKGTAARGGSLHGGLLASQDWSTRSRDRLQAYNQGRGEEVSRQTAERVERGQRSGHTRVMRSRLRKADPSMPASEINNLRGEALEAAVHNAELASLGRKAGDAAARDSTAHFEGRGSETPGMFASDPDRPERKTAREIDFGEDGF